LMKTPLTVLFLFVCSVVSLAGDFTVASPDIKGVYFTDLFVAADCGGGDVSPEIAWQNPPKGTKSFMVTIYDPDAPTGSGWWHWVVADIPATATSLKRGSGNDSAALPKNAVAVNNDFGHNKYGGPCPPQDTDHRYIITVYALSVPTLALPANATAAMAGFVANGSTIKKATTMYRYKR
jgi:Raf kinase inhibitor-like YbhB/YbcL family protein